MFKYGVFPGLYFPACGLNTVRYSVFSPNAGKYGPEKTPYLDTFHAVHVIGLLTLTVAEFIDLIFLSDTVDQLPIFTSLLFTKLSIFT